MPQFKLSLKPLPDILQNCKGACVFCTDPILDTKIGICQGRPYCTQCNNVFHNNCYYQWDKGCPICRHDTIRRYWLWSIPLLKIMLFLYNYINHIVV